MNDSSNTTSAPPSNFYYYKNKPLQHFFRNDYSKEEKLEITMQLESDYKAGMVSAAQLKWIYSESRYGAYTATRILDEMLNKKIIKRNPVTGDDRRFSNPSGKPKTKFDW